MTDRLTRRNFLNNLCAAAAVSLIPGCKCNQIPAAPLESPFYLGPYPVRKAVLGVTPGTTRMPWPTTVSGGETGFLCPDGTITISAGNPIPVMIYYPGYSTSYDINLPIEISQKKNNYPVLLFAHARRLPTCTSTLPAGVPTSILDITQDYTREERMLSHVASYGCVAAVPDMSGLVNRTLQEWADVLAGLYSFLMSLNNALFQNRLDMNRIILTGHSSGGGSCLLARSELVSVNGAQPIAMGLVAPATSGAGGVDNSLILGLNSNGLMVIRGLSDTQVGSDPLNVYNAYNGPKILVSISGANHFGYTDICTPDNKFCSAPELPGTIIPFTQQLIAGAYLSALVRKFALGDASVEPYMNGTRTLEGQIYGVTGIQLQQSGM
jgi:hypothetical protein